MIFDIQWWLERTPHQLDVIRTLANVVGIALLPVCTFLLGWVVKIVRHARREATAARQNTESSLLVDGKYYTVPVIKHIEAAAQETRDGFAWVKGHGRYRSQTEDVPRVTMSNYTREPHD